MGKVHVQMAVVGKVDVQMDGVGKVYVQMTGVGRSVSDGGMGQQVMVDGPWWVSHHGWVSGYDMKCGSGGNIGWLRLQCWVDHVAGVDGSVGNDRWARMGESVCLCGL